MSGLNHTAHFSNISVLCTVLIYLCRRIQNCNNVAKSWIQYTPDREIRLCCVQRDTKPFIVKSPRKIKICIQKFPLILMDPCIVDDSVQIPTRCSFVIEFIIPTFIEDSTCFERHAAHHQKL